MENLNSLSVSIHCKDDAGYDSRSFRSDGKPCVALDLTRCNAVIYFHSEAEIRGLINALWQAAGKLKEEADAIEAERLTPQEQADKALRDVRRHLAEQESGQAQPVVAVLEGADAS